MLAIVTVSAFECGGTNEGFGNPWARREAGNILDLKSTLPGKSWNMGHWRKLMEKNGRAGRKGIVGEPDREPCEILGYGAKCPGL